MSKKLGGRAHSKKQMGDLHDFLAACELRGLGYKGSPSIWCNNREGDGRIFECLDRFLANFLW